MKKIGLVLVLFVGILFGCSEGYVADYKDSEFEKALNNGEYLVGKTVEVEVIHMVPNSAFGYNIQAGQHLNFVSDDHPRVESGDTVILKVTDVSSFNGSYIITYEK
jgi:hypothetical protein